MDMKNVKLIMLDMDGPLFTNDKRITEKTRNCLIAMKEKGIAIMIVNHKLDEIYEICDKLTVLRNGEYVSNGDITEYDRARFIRDLTGRDIEEIKYSPEEDEKEILRVEHLTRAGAFEDVSFTLKKGDVLGITGLLGSGRGELGDALFGLAPAQSGKIILNGKEIQIHSIQDAMNNKIAYVPEDRLTQGLFLERSILDNTMAASIKNYFKKGKLDYKAMEIATDDWIKTIGVATPSAKPAIRTLSGGNQQKVAIAKWLNTSPDLLVLNGPTVGVDIGSKSDIHAILHRLAKGGVGIIVISDDLSELVQNCNKMIVMRNGKVAEVIDNTVDETTLADMLSGKQGG